MADDGQNYSIFNSRLLVDVVGDVIFQDYVNVQKVLDRHILKV